MGLVVPVGANSVGVPDVTGDGVAVLVLSMGIRIVFVGDGVGRSSIAVAVIVCGSAVAVMVGVSEAHGRGADRSVTRNRPNAARSKMNKNIPNNVSICLSVANSGDIKNLETDTIQEN